MRLILCRHGETEQNVKGLVYGNLPSKLTKRGLIQVTKLATALKNYEFDDIFCSDLDRCVETAKVILKVHPSVPITYAKSLREQEQGSLIGKLVKEVDWRNLPPGVETPKDMAIRSKKFLSGLRLSQLRTALIISHRRFLNTFLNVLVGKKPEFESESQLVKNSSLTVVECSAVGKGKILELNDVFHLEK